MGIGERSGAVAVSLQEETLDEEFIESPQIQMYLLTETPGPPCYKQSTRQAYLPQSLL